MPKAPMTKTAKGAFRRGTAGLRRFQFIEPIASPKTLVVVDDGRLKLQSVEQRKNPKATKSQSSETTPPVTTKDEAMPLSKTTRGNTNVDAASSTGYRYFEHVVRLRHLPSHC